MSVDNSRTQIGSRPDLAALPNNNPIGYVGSQVLPVVRMFGKAGTYYYAAVQTDSAATTSRSAGAAPVAVTISENSAAWSAGERIKRYKVPFEIVPLLGGIEKTDMIGGRAAKRSLDNALETAQIAALVDGSGTSITSAIQDGITDACDQVHRYNGRTGLVMDIGQFRWLRQQTEIKNLLSLSFGTMGAQQSMSAPVAAMKLMFAGLLGVDEILVADDKFWPYTYRTTCAVVKLPPQGEDNVSYMTEPEYGRTMVYWPKDDGAIEVNSFPDDDIRSNVYDAISWWSMEEMNSGAKVLLTINTSGSTTGA